jgi:hypothetical protein
LQNPSRDAFRIGKEAPEHHPNPLKARAVIPSLAIGGKIGMTDPEAT